jgi:hypothetical protein
MFELYNSIMIIKSQGSVDPSQLEWLIVKPENGETCNTQPLSDSLTSAAGATSANSSVQRRQANTHSVHLNKAFSNGAYLSLGGDIRYDSSTHTYAIGSWEFKEGSATSKTNSTDKSGHASTLANLKSALKTQSRPFGDGGSAGKSFGDSLPPNRVPRWLHQGSRPNFETQMQHGLDVDGAGNVLRKDSIAHSEYRR